MIAPRFDRGAAEARLTGFPAQAEAALAQAAVDAAEAVRVAADRNLSGDRLQARSGKLRDSLAVDVSVSGGRIAAGIRADAPYAAFQEFGFSGTESVREFLRRQTAAFGRRTAGSLLVPVRSHDRRVDYPGRFYLGAALAETLPSVRGMLAGAVAGAIRS